MTAPDRIASLLPAVVRPYDIREILQVSWNVYQTHYREMVLPVLQAMLLQMVGVGLALLLPYMVSNMVVTGTAQPDPAMLTLWALAVIITGLPGLSLFCWGFWHYLVLMVSLNRNVVEALAHKTVYVLAAYQAVNRQAGPYTNLLLAMMGVSIGIFLLIGLLGWMGFSSGNGFWVVLSVILAAFIGLIGFMMTGVCFCLCLQVFALEGGSLNPLPVLVRSARLFLANWLKGVLVFVILAGLQVGIEVVTTVLDLVGVFYWVSRPLYPLVGLITDTWALSVEMTFPGQSMVMSAIPGLLAQLIFGTLAGAALLPFSTALFTLLYLDSAAKMDPIITYN